MSKYLNKKVDSVDGKFDSKKEYAHWLTLKSLLKSGQVTKVEKQVSYNLKVNNQLICRYVADFVVTHICGIVEVQDVKSDFTRKNRAYRIKRKLMKAIYGIEIVEI